MTNTIDDAVSLPERVIGWCGGHRPGPTLVAVGGIHGNEPAGAAALQRVVASLREHEHRMSGTFVALVGNVRALAQGRRYLDQDLNRLWTAAVVRRRQEMPPREGDCSEHFEQVELLDQIESIMERSHPDHPVLFMDLHTFSAPGPAFSLGGDTLRNRRFLARLPLPVILGLEEEIEGTLSGYMAHRCHVSVGIEGGRSGSDEAVDVLTGSLWLSLVGAGLVAARDVVDLHVWSSRLRELAGRGPAVTGIVYRHALQEDDRFAMQPGFTNLQPVVRGQPLATDRRGVVRARRDALVLMPLYQAMGRDGFFLGRPLGNGWLTASRWARRLALEALLPRLPGVHRVPSLADEGAALRVEASALRRYGKGVFRFFGYRRFRRHGASVRVTRAPDPSHPLRLGP
jgi:succinylglutamate desuccinylase